MFITRTTSSHKIMVRIQVFAIDAVLSIGHYEYAEILVVFENWFEMTIRGEIWYRAWLTQHPLSSSCPLCWLCLGFSLFWYWRLLAKCFDALDALGYWLLLILLALDDLVSWLLVILELLIWALWYLLLTKEWSGVNFEEFVDLVFLIIVLQTLFVT